MKTAECRSCHAPIIWVITQKGKKMPVDVEPNPAGTFIFDGGLDDVGEQHVVYIGEKDPYRGERFTSHFGTCPNAKDFRKKNR